MSADMTNPESTNPPAGDREQAPSEGRERSRDGEWYAYYDDHRHEMRIQREPIIDAESGTYILVRRVDCQHSGTRATMHGMMKQTCFREDDPERFGYVRGWNAAFESFAAALAQPARQMAEALERVRSLLETSSPLEPFLGGLACRHICEDALAAWSGCSVTGSDAPAEFAQQKLAEALATCANDLQSAITREYELLKQVNGDLSQFDVSMREVRYGDARKARAALAKWSAAATLQEKGK